MKKLLLPFFIILVITTSCAFGNKTIVYNEQPKSIDSLEIKEGLLLQHAQRIKYKREGKTASIIEISEPVLVAMAEQDEDWGYFQFPSIGRANDGTLVVSWQMKADSHMAYGKESDRNYVPMMSKDGGLTWTPQDKNYYAVNNGYNVFLKDGSLLEVNTPSSKDVNNYKKFPKPVAKSGNRDFYKMNALPDELQGAYFDSRSPEMKTRHIHAKINDPGLLRSSIDGMMPIVWWGNIKLMSDNSLIAGIYPARYLDANGKLLESSVSFYRSVDDGESWNILGKIPFIKDGIADIIGEGEFTEPVFEILRDSTFVCVMRSGSTSPMYKSFSFDRGNTWSKPEPFTSNGVKPRLLLLNNGVLVLASGRPGIQIRFSLDGKGNEWTDAIDMIPLQKVNNVLVRDVSCGYASIIPEGKDSFYVVYSDFTTKNPAGEVRKSIWFRKITISVK